MNTRSDQNDEGENGKFGSLADRAGRVRVGTVAIVAMQNSHQIAEITLYMVARIRIVAIRADLQHVVSKAADFVTFMVAKSTSAFATANTVRQARSVEPQYFRAQFTKAWERHRVQADEVLRPNGRVAACSSPDLKPSPRSTPDQLD